MLAGKNHVIRRRAVVGALLAASLALVTLSFRDGSEGLVGAVQRATLPITAPFSAAADRVTQPFVDAWDWTRGLVDARQEERRLEAELDRVGAQQVELRELREQNDDLKALLDYQEAAPYETAAGTVVVQSPSPYSGHLTINLGRNDGVSENDPVVAPAGKGAGLIGRIDHVTGNWSTVLLILDRQSSVTAQIQGSTAWGLVEPSDGDPGQLSLKLVPVSERVPRDEVVVTRGNGRERGPDRLESLLPAGIPIGRVTSVGVTDASAYHSIQVTPFVDFQDISEVLVLKVERDE
jgi:rod shape-determining protein MreC